MSALAVVNYGPMPLWAAVLQLVGMLAIFGWALWRHR